MNFSYSNTICIKEEDLDKMAKRVTKGEDFHEVFDEIMNGYDNTIYWTCDFIEEQVEIEVNKRINKAGNK